MCQLNKTGVAVLTCSVMDKVGACVGCQLTDEKHGAPILKINKRRSCTDVPWLMAFVTLWVFAGAMVLLARNRGGDANKYDVCPRSIPDKVDPPPLWGLF